MTEFDAVSADMAGVDVSSDDKLELSRDRRIASSAHTSRRVFIDRLEVVGSIGVYEHEHRYEQRVHVSLLLEVADTYDGQSDRIAHVYDYDTAIRAVRETVEAGHTNLIETLAERIAARCLETAAVEAVIVRIEKPDVVDNCRAVGIEIERRRKI